MSNDGDRISGDFDPPLKPCRHFKNPPVYEKWPYVIFAEVIRIQESGITQLLICKVCNLIHLETDEIVQVCILNGTKFKITLIFKDCLPVYVLWDSEICAPMFVILSYL